MKNSKALDFVVMAIIAFWTVNCAHHGTSGGSSSSGYQGLGPDSINPEEMKKYAAPTLPSAVSSKINMMLDVQTPGAGMIHPNGKTLFFGWRISGSSQIWRIDGPKSFPVQMTGGRDTTSLMEITPDGKYIILQRDIDGQENPGVYLQSETGGPLIKIYHQPKVRAAFQFVSDDSQWIYFTANDQTPDSFAVYRARVKDQKIEPVFAEPGLWSIEDQRGDLLILSKTTGSRTNEVYVFNEKTKSLTPLVGQKTPEEYQVYFGSENGTYLVLTPEIGNFRRLYLLKSGKKLIPITPEIKFDVSEYRVDRNRKRILYEVNEGGFTRLHALDARSFQKITLPSFPKADHVYANSTTRNSRHTILLVVTSQSPRLAFSYDWETGKSTQWTLPSVPEVDLKKFIGSTLEFYQSRDGVQIPMFVRRPASCVKKTCPVVANFHGGPEGQSISGFHTFSQLFVDEGIIFVEPNVRGSEGYGKEWLNSDNGEKRLNVVSDIEDFAVHAKKNWAFDGVTPKVGIMGWSYGGYSALMGMTRFSGSYDSGVALVGISNLLTFLNNTAPYRRKLRATEYGDPEKDKEALIKLSPVTYVDQVKAPLMIIQGATDPRVPVGESVQIHKILQSKNIKSQLIVFPDEGHGAQKKENRVLEWGHTLNFFVQTLKN